MTRLRLRETRFILLLFLAACGGPPTLDEWLRDHCGTPPDGEPMGSPRVQEFIACGDYWAPLYYENYT